ncbi:Imm6 family immunity protein [Thermoactinomyces mirandus]|uniref:Immunity protein Imm6 n=1 Tax=Thermoactinomyces mirandus TaxID=2756294 RepID=A0A7W1XQ88_9BACL|nr:Imm6 family immunity protein [Thermoactinomyces mirandus]MBA4601299.1 hypothetical protein [Thermoactinomyces mirandus]
MKWYENVMDDAKTAFLLTLSEKIMGKIQNYEWFHEVRQTMDMCWKWVGERKYSSNELYEKLDREDEDGYEDGLFLLEAMYDEVVNDPQVELTWFSILDAICYTTWQAYKYEKRKSLPQTLESESDETIDKFMEKIKQVDEYQEELVERLKEYLLANYPAGSDKRIKREKLLSLIC